MNLLLDTHIALWAITDHPSLGHTAREWIGNPRNTVWVSTASLWEIAIKYRLDRSGMPVSAREALDYFQRSGYRLLPIEPEHTLALETLPPHHQDPFDRLLVAQALTEPMRLITHDTHVARYSDTIVFV